MLSLTQETNFTVRLLRGNKFNTIYCKWTIAQTLIYKNKAKTAVIQGQMIQMNTHKDIDRQKHTRFSLLVLMFHSSVQRVLIINCFMIESHRMCTCSHFVMMSSLYSAFHITYCSKAALQKFNLYSPNWALHGDLPWWITQCPFWFLLSLPLLLGVDAFASLFCWYTLKMLSCFDPFIWVKYVTLSMKTQLKSFFCDVHFFYQKEIIHHMVKNILWKCNLYIFNIDWIRSCQILKL